jgi:hypothetical protein
MMDQGELALEAHASQVDCIVNHIENLGFGIINYKEYESRQTIYRFLSKSEINKPVAIKRCPYINHCGRLRKTPFMIVFPNILSANKLRIHTLHQNKGSNFDKVISGIIEDAFIVEGNVLLFFDGPGFRDGAKEFAIRRVALMNERINSEKISIVWDIQEMCEFIKIKTNKKR